MLRKIERSVGVAAEAIVQVSQEALLLSGLSRKKEGNDVEVIVHHLPLLKGSIETDIEIGTEETIEGVAAGTRNESVKETVTIGLIGKIAITIGTVMTEEDEMETVREEMKSMKSIAIHRVEESSEAEAIAKVHMYLDTEREPKRKRLRNRRSQCLSLRVKCYPLLVESMYHRLKCEQFSSK